MRYIVQFLIIIGISFLGELFKVILPFPIPASIYGLSLMFILLKFRCIRLNQVKETASFLIDIMPVMFIPAAVGLIDSWGALSPILIEVIVIIIATTLIVMTITAKVTQWMIRKDKYHNG